MRRATTLQPWEAHVVHSKYLNLSAQDKIGFTAGRPHPVGQVLTSGRLDSPP
jgi:hypothetical protein